MLRRSLVIALSLVSFNAFANVDSSAPVPALPLIKSTCEINNPQSSNLYMATKWYRDSSEQRAIYIQTFRLAAKEIQEQVKMQKLKPKTWGVVMDIDETILDNSDYQESLVENCSNFSPKTWSAFVKSEVSTPTPGAVEFTKKIHDLGGVVNLVTGRTENLREATVSNLNKYGFAYDQIILATSGTNGMEKNKLFNSIRQGVTPSQIKTKQDIIAYFGDNIQDFPNVEQKTMITQDVNSDAYNKFGAQYFVLPNPMYGTWPKNK